MSRLQCKERERSLTNYQEDTSKVAEDVSGLRINIVPMDDLQLPLTLAYYKVAHCHLSMSPSYGDIA